MDIYAFDPKTDLQLTRSIAATPATVWRCITEADLLEQWFCPAPWGVKNATIEAHPGGIMHTPMFGPDGATMDEGPGCVLVADTAKAFAFTDAMMPGFRPKEGGFMTGVYLLEATEAGTKITARALHANAETQAKHAEMGFELGWGAAMDQIKDLAESL